MKNMLHKPSKICSHTHKRHRLRFICTIVGDIFSSSLPSCLVDRKYNISRAQRYETRRTVAPRGRIIRKEEKSQKSEKSSKLLVYVLLDSHRLLPPHSPSSYENFGSCNICCCLPPHPHQRR